jgi:hypothetical protein
MRVYCMYIYTIKINCSEFLFSKIDYSIFLLIIISIFKEILGNFKYAFKIRHRSHSRIYFVDINRT